jgi:hypothetical protein
MILQLDAYWKHHGSFPKLELRPCPIWRGVAVGVSLCIIVPITPARQDLEASPVHLHPAAKRNVPLLPTVIASLLFHPPDLLELDC